METLPPDRYLGPRRYKISYVCDFCGHQWDVITEKLSRRDPKCPVRECRDAQKAEEDAANAQRREKMLAEQRAPAVTGANVVVKAVDETARIVMEDHGLTDLKDNVREGEGVAPKLPAVGPSGMPMNKAAEGFFGGGAVRGHAGIRNEKQAALLGRRAMAGAFRGMALNPAQVVPGRPGEAVLRPVRTEKLREG